MVSRVSLSFALQMAPGSDPLNCYEESSAAEKIKGNKEASIA
jgi:hypothetical protein